MLRSFRCKGIYHVEVHPGNVAHIWNILRWGGSTSIDFGVMFLGLPGYCGSVSIGRTGSWMVSAAMAGKWEADIPVEEILPLLGYDQNRTPHAKSK